jgi:hypothetical protein
MHISNSKPNGTLSPHSFQSRSPGLFKSNPQTSALVVR